MKVTEYPNLTIVRETQATLPRVAFRRIKEELMGKDYDLTLIFPSPKRATNMHQEWKSKDGPANILSFPFDKKTGEIYISLSQARRECKNFGRSYESYLGFLFIHGLLHLKGFTHGSRMEKEERRYCDLFNFSTHAKRAPHTRWN
jgi:probable rRNA maturation factor